MLSSGRTIVTSLMMPILFLLVFAAVLQAEETQQAGDSANSEPQLAPLASETENTDAEQEKSAADERISASESGTETLSEQSGGEEAPSLGEIVVSAARRASSWKDAPAMVSVIEGEEIVRAPEKTLDDFLKRVPSVSYSRVHAAECGPGRDITLRGIMEQKRTLILVDGIPVNDGVTGAVNWSMIPKEAVERIEIVRGPMSALYGSGAMGGVINIITKKPASNNETLIKGGYGSLNTYSATLLQGGMFEKAGYSLGGNIYKSDGYIQAREKQPYHSKNARTDASLMGRLYVKPDDSSMLSFSVNYVNEDYSRGIQTDNQTNETAYLNATYERELTANANLTASFYSQFMSREVDLGARPDYVKHDHTEYDDVTKLGQMLQTDFKFADFNTFTVGVDSSYSMMEKHNDYALVERKAKAEGNQLLASLFAQDEMKFTSGEKHKVLLTPGLRVDFSRSSDGKSSDTNPAPNPPVDEKFEDRSWVAVNPKLGLVYRYNNSTTLRASAGHSFAAPTLFELYTVFTRGPVLLYGNPDLDPESAWSAELGLDQWFMTKLLGRVTGYFTRGDNFIGSRSIAENRLKMDNISEVQILGSDFELRYDINSMWTLYGGYTFNHSTILNDENNSEIEGNRLPFQAQHRARLGLVFQYLKWIAVDFSARYEGDRYVDMENTRETMLDGYFSLDLSLSGTVVKYVSWTLSIENMLDKRYDVYSVPTEISEAPGVLISGYLSFAI